MEIIKPDKDMIKTLDEVLAQNRKILEMNRIIADSICYPAMVVSADEGRVQGHNLKPGEVVYK